MEIEITLLSMAESKPIHLATVKMFQQHMIMFYIYLLLHFLLSSSGGWWRTGCHQVPALHSAWKVPGRMFILLAVIPNSNSPSSSSYSWRSRLKADCPMWYHATLVTCIQGKISPCGLPSQVRCLQRFVELHLYHSSSSYWCWLNLWSANIHACGTAV